VLAGRRRAAVAMTAAAGVCSLTFLRWSPAVLPLAISVCILELAALAGSPGPRRGRDLVHWGHGVVLLLCAAAVASYTALLRQAPREPLVTLLLMVIVVAALATLAKAVRLSRYFRLLLAALAYPCALALASQALWWRWFSLTFPEWLALVFAGPVLTAAIAVISTLRPRRRQII
jgi:hypothetical protein